jgi:hypothetical protein
MSENIQLRLVKLRADYNQLRESPFSYFYCPILFKDENVPLCRGHIINLAFPNSARNWVVQRQDIDNFFGSIFESDFTAIKYNGVQILGNTIVDKNLSKKFEPKILMDDNPVDFYIARDNVPKQFTRLKFDNDGKEIQLAVKMQPEEFMEKLGRKWEIAIEKDIRIPAMVSLIKSAHLTLFSLLGYSYALSTSGYFVGNDILGKFFQQNYDKEKSDVLDNAHSFFCEFAAMVRPIQSSGVSIRGTITDNLMLICKDEIGLPWAFIVFVRISQSLHAVMIPILEQPGSVSKFIGFLKDENENVSVNFARFNQDHWSVDKGSTTLVWPKTGILYP